MSRDSLVAATLVRLGQSIRATIATTCFWLAVVWPVAYVSVIVDGLTAGEQPVFVGLLLAHAVVLVLGHRGYDRSEREFTPRGRWR